MTKTKIQTKKIGVLTGGGDCPGLNAAIRAIVKRGAQIGIETIGIKQGWQGMLENKTEILNEKRVSGILSKGGTILGSSRTNPLKIKNGLNKIKSNFKKLKLFALIVIGGDDTLSVAQKFFKIIPIVVIPKTIDNDLTGTDYCIGFQTAVQTATEAIDRLCVTAESHNRVMVVEVMGRHFGWIAAYAGLAGGADFILIPEISVDIDKICDALKRERKKGKKFSIIVVSEGAKLKGKLFSRTERRDAFGNIELGGIGQIIANFIKEKTGLEVKLTNLGHIIRGGSPCAFDRILGSCFGVKAIEMVARKQFNKMVALKGDKIISAPISKIKGQRKVNKEVYRIAEKFFIS